MEPKVVKVVLKSGAVLEVIVADKTKSVIGLWVWASRQAVGQILSFENVSILSTEIASIFEDKQDFQRVQQDQQLPQEEF